MLPDPTMNNIPWIRKMILNLLFESYGEWNEIFGNWNQSYNFEMGQKTSSDFDPLISKKTLFFNDFFPKP